MQGWSYTSLGCWVEVWQHITVMPQITWWIHQAFSLHFYILQVIKNWRHRRSGNESNCFPLKYNLDSDLCDYRNSVYLWKWRWYLLLPRTSPLLVYAFSSSLSCVGVLSLWSVARVWLREWNQLPLFKWAFYPKLTWGIDPQLQLWVTSYFGPCTTAAAAICSMASVGSLLWWLLCFLVNRQQLAHTSHFTLHTWGRSTCVLWHEAIWANLALIDVR